jgi:hypothetical protein
MDFRNRLAVYSRLPIFVCEYSGQEMADVTPLT